MSSYLKLFAFIAAFGVVGCSDSQTPIFSSSPSAQAATASGGQDGYYKIGNPYQVAGVTYYPKEDYSYKEVGVSSWYGADFHNGITANGEVYDMHSLTAAHRTLPLPCVVRVTNLQNGRSLVLRVNDRGPFVNNRIIDVSMRAAQLLGFKDKGTTQVQVEILPEESRSLKEEILARQSGNGKKGVVPQTYEESTQNEMMTAVPPKPQSLAPVAATSYPRLANAPSADVSGALVSADVGADAGVTSTQASYNAWDADRPQAVAQKTYPAENGAAKTSPAVKTAALPAAKPAVQQTVKTAPKKTAAKPVAAPVTKSVVSDGAFSAGYYVQVGAFSSKENADKMVRRVSSFGKTSVSPVDVRGKTLYRVRLGPANAQKGLEIMDNVTAAGISGARLVEEKRTSSAASTGSAGFNGGARRSAAYRSDDEF